MRLRNFRNDGTAFLSMLSLRPLLDLDDNFRFMVGVVVEVSDSFAHMKPRLMQVDRLLRLMPTKLPVASPLAAADRAALGSPVGKPPPPTFRMVIDRQGSQSIDELNAGLRAMQIPASAPVQRRSIITGEIVPTPPASGSGSRRVVQQRGKAPRFT